MNGVIMKKIPSMHFFGCIEGLSNDDIEVAGAAAFQEIRPGAGCKTGDFVQKKRSRAAAVERLRNVFK